MLDTWAIETRDRARWSGNELIYTAATTAREVWDPAKQVDLEHVKAAHTDTASRKGMVKSGRMVFNIMAKLLRPPREYY